MMQKIEHSGPRVESGAVQFGNDWPGLFIRGDCSISLGLRIDNLLAWLEKQPSSSELFFEIAELKGIRDTIFEDVVVHA